MSSLNPCAPTQCGYDGPMTSGGRISLRTSFRVWVLILLLLFLALCGIHLLGAHHDGESQALGLVIAVAALLRWLASGRSTQGLVFASIDLCRSTPLIDKPRLARPIRAPIRV
jgi:hypothetical protein